MEKENKKDNAQGEKYNKRNNLAIHTLNSILEMATWDNLKNESPEKQIEDLVYALTKIRKEKKISQTDLAIKADITQTTISRIETFRATPTISAIFKIVKALDYKIALIPNISDTDSHL